MPRANRIRALREARGWSQQDVARRLGCAQSQVDRLEKSERRMTVDWLLRLAAVFGVPVNALVPELGGGPADHTEAELLERWRRASAINRQSVLNLLRTISPDARGALDEEPPADLTSSRTRGGFTLHEDGDDAPLQPSAPLRR